MANFLSALLSEAINLSFLLYMLGVDLPYHNKVYHKILRISIVCYNYFLFCAFQPHTATACILFIFFLHFYPTNLNLGIDKAEKIEYNTACRLMQRPSALMSMEKYSRGRRGAPAKGVGRLYRRESSNLSFSAKKDTRYCIRFALITLYLVSFAFAHGVYSFCFLFWERSRWH